MTLIEVGPRDGLQNQSTFVDSAHKIKLINLLSHSGLEHIEVTSFVSPKSIPQLADNQYVFHHIEKVAPVHYSALIPNEKGMLKALEAGVTEINVFTAASEEFNLHNINCTIDQSLIRIAAVIKIAKQHRMTIRAYISCALGCPYQGHVPPEQVANVAQKLLDLGVDELSLGDTIGVGTPMQTHNY